MKERNENNLSIASSERKVSGKGDNGLAPVSFNRMNSGGSNNGLAPVSFDRMNSGGSDNGLAPVSFDRIDSGGSECNLYLDSLLPKHQGALEDHFSFESETYPEDPSNINFADNGPQPMFIDSAFAGQPLVSSSSIQALAQFPAIPTNNQRSLPPAVLSQQIPVPDVVISSHSNSADSNDAKSDNSNKRNLPSYAEKSAGKRQRTEKTPETKEVEKDSSKEELNTAKAQFNSVLEKFNTVAKKLITLISDKQEFQLRMSDASDPFYRVSTILNDYHENNYKDKYDSIIKQRKQNNKQCISDLLSCISIIDANIGFLENIINSVTNKRVKKNSQAQPKLAQHLGSPKIGFQPLHAPQTGLPSQPFNAGSSQTRISAQPLNANSTQIRSQTQPLNASSAQFRSQAQPLNGGSPQTALTSQPLHSAQTGFPVQPLHAGSHQTGFSGQSLNAGLVQTGILAQPSSNSNLTPVIQLMNELVKDLESDPLIFMWKIAKINDEQQQRALLNAISILKPNAGQTFNQWIINRMQMISSTNMRNQISLPQPQHQALNIQSSAESSLFAAPSRGLCPIVKVIRIQDPSFLETRIPDKEFLSCSLLYASLCHASMLLAGIPFLIDAALDAS